MDPTACLTQLLFDLSTLQSASRGLSVREARDPRLALVFTTKQSAELAEIARIDSVNQLRALATWLENDGFAPDVDRAILDRG